MNYSVIVQRLAQADLEEAFVRNAKRAPQTAARWLIRFEATIRSLASNPLRFPPAFESKKVTVDLRECLFGRRPSVYRILFIIEQNRVRVLRIRRAQRRRLTQRDIDEALDEPT